MVSVMLGISAVTPAIRLNDTTDIWSARGGRYKEEPSRHHRTARVEIGTLSGFMVQTNSAAVTAATSLTFTERRITFG